MKEEFDITQQEYILMNLLENTIKDQVCRIGEVLYIIQDVIITSRLPENSADTIISIRFPLLGLTTGGRNSFSMEVDEVVVGQYAGSMQEFSNHIFDRLAEKVEIIDKDTFNSKAFRAIYL